MRRVGVVIWSALVVALAGPAHAVEPEIVTPTPEATAAPTPAPEPTKDDYYTRRAKSVLEAEKAAAVSAHPLASRYPGMDVVICEAGCTQGSGASVVFQRRKVVPAEASAGPVSERREGQMVPTSDTKADAVTGDALCVAGCYDRTASTDVEPEEPAEVEQWYPSTPPAPMPPRDKLSPIR